MEYVTANVLYKKSDSSNCDNYRGVSPVSNAGRALFKIMASHLSDYRQPHKILTQEHRGFHADRSTIDVLFVVHRLHELGRRREISSDMCLDDLPKAYNAVDRELFW